jgi:hypothetical protein
MYLHQLYRYMGFCTSAKKHIFLLLEPAGITVKDREITGSQAGN